jgi:GR25 family glycosyltransferase involved in LPS biosynthesis
MDLGVDEIYVIGLDRLDARKQHMIELSNKLNVDFNFISGIDATKLNDSEVYDYIKDGFFDPNGIYSNGIICCALSHRKAWKAFLDSDNEFGLFLEDDVITRDQIYKYDFSSIREQLSNIDWGVCWYGKYFEYVAISESISEEIGVCDFFNNSQFAGHAYVLNRESAEWFYKNTETIKYATDIRLEVSPFRQITLKKSVFVQKGKGHLDEEFRDSIDSIDPQFIKSNTLTAEMCDYNEKTGKCYFSFPSDLNRVEENISHNGREIKGYLFTKK